MPVYYHAVVRSLKPLAGSSLTAGELYLVGEIWVALRDVDGVASILLKEPVPFSPVKGFLVNYGDLVISCVELYFIF